MSLSNLQIKFFADFIYKELGIVYSEDVYFQLEHRLEKVAGYLGISSTDEVYAKAKNEGIFGDFKKFLLDVATNNETSFFRDPKIWAAIEAKLTAQKVRPNIFRYRIWSTAASFGQEPYSLAMLIYEFSNKNSGFPPVELLATDISELALKRCDEGHYSQLEIQRGLSAVRIAKYFTKLEDDSWKLKPEIKNIVEFKKKNLLDSFSDLGLFNFILCRNVLIYQNEEQKKTIIKKFRDCLVPKGFLLLGVTESLIGISEDFEQKTINGIIVYQKKM